MHFKRTITAAIAGASLLFTMGTAGAADINVNIYGASAQFNYWNAMAPKFLRDMKSCTNVQQAMSQDAKNSVTKATCGTDTAYIRVSSKASYDGVYAALRSDSSSINRVNNCDSAGYGYRRMINESATGCTWVTVPTDGSPYTIPATCPNPSSTSDCKEVTIGASDVDSTSFQQSSYGKLLGPSTATNNVDTTREFDGSIDASSLELQQPIVVPFAFFANKTVTKDSSTITNIPRMMAVMIFSGQVTKWSDFGSDYVDQPITACLRHAGSGTHSTLDLGVMHSAWGGLLLQNENAAEGYTIAWFNDGSGDMMYCLNSLNYSIGYADADQALLPKYPNVTRLNYNGVTPSALNIINGQYDNFWSVQRSYIASDIDPTTKANWVDLMLSFAGDPNNIPASMLPYYAAECELKYTKNSDAEYPTYRGNNCDIVTH